MADAFGKEHFHVLSDIYFIETTYTDNNRTYSKYLLTRDAFTNIEMGYKVEKATEFKMAFISSGFGDARVNE